jgi:predicted aminopeptidase
LPVNNAYIELYNLYYEEDNYFKDLYKKHGSNLPSFILAAKSIKKMPKDGDPKLELEKALKDNNL